MLSTKIWLAAILAGFVAGQFNSSSFTVPPAVNQDQKAQWCIAERNTCPDLCGGTTFVQENNCIGAQIPKFDCICTNGTAPTNIEDYIGSVPNSICIATFEQCREENPGSDDCPICGTLKASDVPKGVISSTRSSTPTATATEVAETASAASVTPSETPGAAAGPLLTGSVSSGLAMGVMAAVGLLW